MRKIEGTTRYIVISLGCFISIFHLYTAFAGVFSPYTQRGMHLAFLLPLVFLLYPGRKKDINKVVASDFVWFALSILPSLYVIFNKSLLENRLEFVTPLEPVEIVLGVIMLFCVAEAVRRSVSPIMCGLMICALVYLVCGPILPGIFYHSGLAFERLVESFYLTTGEGFYGGLMGISASYIAVFVIFGSVIQFVGAGEFFTEFGRWAAGSARGGPAKIAVISSCLLGTVCGSAVANVYGSGNFSIPLMKRLGFKPTFAGAVEAVASTGGQIMPPVMGAAAFLVADSLGIPYISLALKAFIPAIIYYISLYIFIDMECAKNGLMGEPRSELPRTGEILRQSYLFVPIVSLFCFLLMGYSVPYSAFLSIILSIVTSFLSKKTFMTPKKLILALSDGASSTCMITAALAGASIIVVSLSYSGLGLSFTSVVLSISGGNGLVTLVCVAITAMILGMGVPTVPAYVIASALGVPVLVKLGFEPIVCHMFVFYFAALSNITPPVAVAAYAGANIANAPAMKTAITSSRIAAVAYILPFMFAYRPALFCEGSVVEIVWAFLVALVGAYLLASAIQGWLGGVGVANIFQRLLAGTAGVCMLFPTFTADAVGFFIVLMLVVYEYLRRSLRKSRLKNV